MPPNPLGHNPHKYTVIILPPPPPPPPPVMPNLIFICSCILLLLFPLHTCLLNMSLQQSLSFIHSHEAILFRKFLAKKNYEDFQSYVNIKAMRDQLSMPVPRTKENIEFWLEVQKYKVGVLIFNDLIFI